MSKKVFISGSISIKKLPEEVKKSIENIIYNNFEILVGDASGVDTLVQKYCSKNRYFNVTIYSIFDIPRNKISDKFKFKKIQVNKNIKKEVQRQQEKDKAMTKDSDYCLVIWDEKSKGSYANILRAIEYNKKIKVYLSKKKKFLEKDKINKPEIEYIYRESNGYTASEVIAYLKENFFYCFKNSKELYNYLLQKSIIRKENSIYVPTGENLEMFIVYKFKGRAKGIKFKNEFIDWIEKEIKHNSFNQKDGQLTLF